MDVTVNSRILIWPMPLTMWTSRTRRYWSRVPGLRSDAAMSTHHASTARATRESGVRLPMPPRWSRSLSAADRFRFAAASVFPALWTSRVTPSGSR